MEEIEKEFGDIFTGNGRFSGEVHLEVDDTVPPGKTSIATSPSRNQTPTTARPKKAGRVTSH